MYSLSERRQLELSNNYQLTLGLRSKQSFPCKQTGAPAWQSPQGLQCLQCKLWNIQCRTWFLQCPYFTLQCLLYRFEGTLLIRYLETTVLNPKWSLMWDWMNFTVRCTFAFVQRKVSSSYFPCVNKASVNIFSRQTRQTLSFIPIILLLTHETPFRTAFFAVSVYLPSWKNSFLPRTLLHLFILSYSSAPYVLL